MEQYTKAILWAANKGNAGPHMPEKEADPEENSYLAERDGAVYWDTSAGRKKELKGPFDGYIYVAKPVGKVMYKCTVEHLISRSTLLKKEEEHKYVPDFRRQCLLGHFEDGKSHKPSETWIKMSKIEKLNQPLSLDMFKKLKDGKPVENTRSGVIYVELPELTLPQTTP